MSMRAGIEDTILCDTGSIRNSLAQIVRQFLLDKQGIHANQHNGIFNTGLVSKDCEASFQLRLDLPLLHTLIVAAHAIQRHRLLRCNDTSVPTSAKFVEFWYICQNRLVDQLDIAIYDFQIHRGIVCIKIAQVCSIRSECTGHSHGNIDLSTGCQILQFHSFAGADEQAFTVFVTDHSVAGNSQISLHQIDAVAQVTSFTTGNGTVVQQNIKLFFCVVGVKHIGEDIHITAVTLGVAIRNGHIVKGISRSLTQASQVQVTAMGFSSTASNDTAVQHQMGVIGIGNKNVTTKHSATAGNHAAFHMQVVAIQGNITTVCQGSTIFNGAAIDIDLTSICTVNITAVLAGCTTGDGTAVDVQHGLITCSTLQVDVTAVLTGSTTRDLTAIDIDQARANAGNITAVGGSFTTVDLTAVHIECLQLIIFIVIFTGIATHDNDGALAIGISCSQVAAIQVKFTTMVHVQNSAHGTGTAADDRTLLSLRLCMAAIANIQRTGNVINTVRCRDLMTVQTQSNFLIRSDL